MNFNRIVRLILATSLVSVAVGLTASEQGANGQTSGSAEGRIEIPDCHVSFYRSAALATDRPGIIAEMPFDEGDSLSKGDLVVRLRDDVAVANLALATQRAESYAAVEVAEKEAEAAALEVKAFEEGNRRYAEGGNALPLYSETVVERSRLIKQAREKAVIRAQEEAVLNARAQDQAQAELDSYRIVSKHSGIVTRVLKREGEAVQQGEAILEVIDPTVARIEGKLEYSQARRLKVGMPVEVRLDFEDAELPVEQELFLGTIGFIDFSATSGFHDVRVWAEVQNRDGILLDNLPARMSVHVGESR